MPGTAELLNIDPNDLTQNIYGGIKYFKFLLEKIIIIFLLHLLHIMQDKGT